MKITNLVKDKKLEDTTVMVAMSGGVDSSTIAVYLHQKGCKVIGITMKLYSTKNTSSKTCCTDRDIKDAKKTAEKHGFPHYIVNYESTFKQEVVEKFAQSYLNGETPIPCILCNQTVKFRDLLSICKNLGADVLVTGHYIRRIEREKNEIELHQAVDIVKDQSYFLFATTKEQLKVLRFPLGEISKKETRKLAEQMLVPTANKKESQDICFVGDGEHHKIIDQIRDKTNIAGKFIHVNGTTLGYHNGIHKFTIGQRHGLKISFAEPLYVIKIDSTTKNIIVGPKKYLRKAFFTVDIINWLKDIKNKKNITVKIRSGTKKIKANMRFIKKNTVMVHLLETEIFAIAPGQACVFYDKSLVMGGGWIKK